MSTTICAASLAAVAGLSSLALATPTNTTLPGGWSWQPLPGGTYDTGTVATKRGGSNGQTSGALNDTSFGIMDEPNPLWFDGSDQSAQQYVQAQVFGNFGTGSPPGPSGFRFFNAGYNGTGFGANFSNFTTEQRSVSLNHWSNPFPDAGGVASLNQVVYVPVSATLIVGHGFGADEMLMKAIGGNGGGTSKFLINSAINSAWNTSSFGGIVNTNNSISLGTQTEVFDPGAIGNYDVPFGFGVGLAGGQISLNNVGTVTDQGTITGAAGQGIPVNSIGTGMVDSYNVLSTLLQDGSSFNISFNGSALINIQRLFGNADARASMGPGMEGNVRLVVEWAAFQAIPTPGAVALLGLGGLMAARRRR